MSMSMYGTFNFFLRQALPERNTFFQGIPKKIGVKGVSAENNSLAI